MSTQLPHAHSPKQKAALTENPLIANLKHVHSIIAVSSGKGGVGKSTVASNLAVTLAKQGFRVGLMDADVYGPSISKMMGGKDAEVLQKDNQLIPVEKYGVKWMSMALLTDEDTPVIWRGPMATRLIQQFLGQVAWGQLDYLIIDLPPGTGDVQLTLTQSISLQGAIVVSTPQEVAVEVALRGIKMFDEVRVPILGIVENMSGVICTHCHQETPVFPQGVVKAKANELGIHYLGSIPLDPSVAIAGDQGQPISLASGPVATIFSDISSKMVAQLQEIEARTTEATESPTQISSDEKHVLLMWKDGSVSEIPFFDLRLACPCANCVNEATGKRMIEAKDIKQGIEPVGFRPVGKYGLQISWNDGHNTGIYTFNSLRSFGA
ncbi:MAG: P-loop NTPase [Bdellovibrionales bacterium]|nr:P-loop NTPase [Bdellovibrionales bacterium]